MANPVMNYNQFMAAFKKAESGYSPKANTKNDDAKGTAKIKQEMAEKPISGKGTPQIEKYTKQHLGRVKAKKATK